MAADSLSFTITPDVQFLGIPAAVFFARGVRNRRSDPAFDAEWETEMDALRAGLTKDALRADPILNGYRALHSAIGVSNKRNPSASAALLTCLLETGRVARVNLLVDLYNLFSMQTRLSLGAHDAGRLQGDVTLRLTGENDGYIPMGTDEWKPIRAGEYAYADAAGVICRLEMRQCDRTKITPETTDAMIVLQGNPATPPAMLREAMDELQKRIRRYCGGEMRVLMG